MTTTISRMQGRGNPRITALVAATAQTLRGLRNSATVAGVSRVGVMAGGLTASRQEALMARMLEIGAMDRPTMSETLSAMTDAEMRVLLLGCGYRIPARATRRGLARQIAQVAGRAAGHQMA